MTPSSSDRYSRQILFHGVGEEGQRRIRGATAAIVGCGALGSYQAEALARAGIGRLVLIDRDYVDISNLQRQWLYDESDALHEVPKAIAAGRRLNRLNSDVAVTAQVSDLTPSNAEELLENCGIILDGTDNFETRYLLNDISVKTGVPWMYGAALGSYGVTMPVVPGRGPCLACVYPEAPAGLQATCDIDGILASTTTCVGALQVASALRLICGWENFDARIQTLDVWTGAVRSVPAGPSDPECVTCGRREFRYLQGRKNVPVSLCGRNAVQLHDSGKPLDLPSLAERLRPIAPVRVNEFALRVNLPKYDVTVFPDGRAIVKGTTDVGVARSVYAQLIGA